MYLTIFDTCKEKKKRELIVTKLVTWP